MRSILHVPTTRHGRAAFGLLLIYLLLAITYSVVTPPWEAPDEVGHFEFITTLRLTHALPIQQIGDLGEAQQPPLYYVLATIASLPANFADSTGAFQGNTRFMWGGRGQQVNAGLHGTEDTFPFQGLGLGMHLARLTSALLGLLTVGFTIAIGWMIFPDKRRVGLLAGTLVAFNPQFLFISGAINNDTLLTAAATGAWWQLLRATREPTRVRQWLYVGAWTGTAILAKPSGTAIGAVALVALVYAGARRSSPAIVVKGGLAIGAVVAVLSGWWFARNQILYGDPLGWTVFQKVYSADLRHDPLKLSDLRQFATVEFHSFWGVFGWMNVYPPGWFYPAAGALTIVGVLGFGLFCGRWFSRLTDFQKSAIAIVWTAGIVQELSLIEMITRWDASGYQGRYFFPAIGPATLIVSLGLWSLLPKRLGPIGIGLLGVGLLGVATYIPFGIIEPAYPSVPLPKSALWQVPNSTDVAIGQTMALRGYTVQSTVDSSQIQVTLYWLALKRPDFDYSVFVHVIDNHNEIVAQKDQGPGAAAGDPPTGWLPGDLIADTHTIALPPHLRAGTYRLRVGVYNWRTGQQLPVGEPGKNATTYLILTDVIQRGGGQSS